MNVEKEKKTIVLLLFLLIISFSISMGSGSVIISPREILNTILYNRDSTNFQIIWNVRLPRTIAALFVGINLSLSGLVLQGVMRNPLASPNIIGVSSGAGLAALIILILFPSYYYLLPLGAFLGALGATLLIYFLAWNGGIMPTRLILAGVAISSLFGAGNNALLTFYPDRVSGVISFMVGGLSSINWQDVKMIIPYSIIGMTFLLFLPSELNILTLGDEVAQGLGINVEKTRFKFIILASLLAGSAVSVVGLLGFVGLIVPHITRLLIGSNHKYLIPGTLLMGGSMLMSFDTLSRTLFRPTEVPVGIIMSILGAPFFLHLLRKRKGSHGN